MKNLGELSLKGSLGSAKVSKLFKLCCYYFDDIIERIRNDILKDNEYLYQKKDNEYKRVLRKC